MSSTVAPDQSWRARMAASISPSGSTARFSVSYTSGWCQMLGDGMAPSSARGIQAFFAPDRFLAARFSASTVAG